MHLRKGRSVFAAVAATSVAALLCPAGALASHGVTAPISVNSAGVIGDDQSNYADMTPDGRFVSFASLASNLVPGDTNGVGDVFVRDRRAGVTERVSLGIKGARGRRRQQHPRHRDEHRDQRRRPLRRVQVGRFQPRPRRSQRDDRRVRARQGGGHDRADQRRRRRARGARRRRCAGDQPGRPLRRVRDARFRRGLQRRRLPARPGRGHDRADQRRVRRRRRAEQQRQSRRRARLGWAAGGLLLERRQPRRRTTATAPGRVRPRPERRHADDRARQRLQRRAATELRRRLRLREQRARDHRRRALRRVPVGRRQLHLPRADRQLLGRLRPRPPGRARPSWRARTPRAARPTARARAPT